MLSVYEGTMLEILAIYAGKFYCDGGQLAPFCKGDAPIMAVGERLQGNSDMPVLRLRKLSLSSAPFYTSLMVIVTLGLFIGSFWAYIEYDAYRDSVANIRANYDQQYRKRLREEVDRITDFVEYKRVQQDSRIEIEIRERVQAAYSIAAHVYSLYRQDNSVDELRRMVVELLRPIRWDNGLGYYFAGRLSTGYLDLFAENPQLEGFNLLEHENPQIREVAKLIIDTVSAKGAGQIKYSWSKPETAGMSSPKVTFVKYFSPFDWFIGAGVYVDEMLVRTQKDILDRIGRVRFGEEGQVTVFRLDGTILSSSRDTSLRGRSIATLVDVRGTGYGAEVLDIARQVETGGGYFIYSGRGREAGNISERLGYVRDYADWGWAVAASISMVEMEKAIAVETETYMNITFKNTALFLVLFLLAVTALLCLSYFYSLRIRSGIDHFNEFFRKAVDSKARVEENELGFKEFAVLGEYANRMNADRLAKEKIIRRDEKRLDTLLQLGLMDSSSLSDLYDFTLLRIAEIVDSEAAYLVTIEDKKTLLQSQVVYDGGQWRSLEIERGSWVSSDLDLQKVIHNQHFGLKRNTSSSSANTLFAIEENLIHRLDLPVFENGRVVAVVGVCNKASGYTEDDKRQIALLLEGMWLHVTRVVGRKEMIRLRRLLKNITDSMPSMLIGVDGELRVMQWNRLTEQQTGVKEADAQNRQLMELMPRLDVYRQQILQVIDSGRQMHIRRIPMEGKEGLRYESITIFPLTSEERQGAVLRFDDVTDWVAMEEMMIQSEKMLSLGGLAAGIAHEINNPLASVSQSLQVVRKRLSSELEQNRSAAAELGLDLEQLRHYLQNRGVEQLLEIIGSDTERAARLVHNMLSFSRTSASSLVEADVRVLLDNALDLGLADYDLKKNYDFRQICLCRDYEEDVPVIQCEKTNIQQVFLNIIRNAAHAIAENRNSGQVPTLALRITGTTNGVVIEIEDNGVGMDSTTCKKIFEPFFTTKDVGRGTGLGLSISYYIVADQHKGSLRVRSQPGKGTVFTIELPVIPDAEKKS